MFSQYHVPSYQHTTVTPPQVLDQQCGAVAEEYDSAAQVGSCFLTGSSPDIMNGWARGTWYNELDNASAGLTYSGSFAANPIQTSLQTYHDPSQNHITYEQPLEHVIPASRRWQPQFSWGSNPPPASSSSSSFYSSRQLAHPVVESITPPEEAIAPSPVLPTPVDMAVLMGPPSAADQRLSMGHMMRRDPHLPEPPRDKKYPCSMCHKSFDRPSTLKKHFLVHTGEKAYECQFCKRRFGVASNLNRHVKKCRAREEDDIATSPTVVGSPLLKSKASTSLDTTIITKVEACRADVAGKSKRRRRAPSPTNWVPPSLLGLNLVSPDSEATVSLPLPPVFPVADVEERNSWDENVPLHPYHPAEWRNRLPGPALSGLGRRKFHGLNAYGDMETIRVAAVY